MTSRKGPLEKALLAFAMLGFFVPLIWLATSALSFAEYPLHPAALVLGIACLAFGLWMFYRSHADLGTNWAISVEVRENHRLVTQGVYQHVRHPMYAGLCLYREEQMMLDEFGDEYAAYMARTKRLIPGVW